MSLEHLIVCNVLAQILAHQVGEVLFSPFTMDEDTEAQRGKGLTHVTQLGSG